MPGPIPRFEPGRGSSSRLATTIDALSKEASMIAPARRESLDRVTTYLQRRRDSGAPAKLLFICTHNSRRSQIAQLWAQAAAVHHGVERVETASGGTEVTAFAPRAVDAMRAAGFEIRVVRGVTNPRYEIRFGADGPVLELFSKRFDDEVDRCEGCCAVMTCSSADVACPHVPGAEVRVSLPYDDPKAADGTPDESAAYDECCRRIGREMLYVFSRLV